MKTRPSQQNNKIFFRGTILRGLTQPLNRVFLKEQYLLYFYNGR
jgi:hypothetical protein